MAESRLRTATHAVPVVRGSSVPPLFVTASGMPPADADLVRRMAGRYRLPDAPRRADTLARTRPPAATMTDRLPPDLRRRPERGMRMFAPIAAGFVLVDTEGWFWIRTVGAPGRRPS
jgi:hypothetical protein